MFEGTQFCHKETRSLKAFGKIYRQEEEEREPCIMVKETKTKDLCHPAVALQQLWTLVLLSL